MHIRKGTFNLSYDNQPSGFSYWILHFEQARFILLKVGINPNNHTLSKGLSLCDNLSASLLCLSFFIGMTKVKMSKGEEGGPEAFIDRRKAALERYLNRTARHPKLREDPDFKEFLEAESVSLFISFNNR